MTRQLPRSEFSLAFVEAPLCASCMAKLRAATATTWECAAGDCEKRGEEVKVDGAYPFFLADLVYAKEAKDD